MAAQNLIELMRRVDELTPDEQLRLAEYLVCRAREAVAQPSGEYAWADVAGIARYPLAGEDAQEWVSRTRRESDEHRAQSWTETQ